MRAFVHEFAQILEASERIPEFERLLQKVMPAIQIRDVPAEVIAALKRRASRNERSLEGELRYLLAAPLPPLQLKLSQAPSSATTWSREEIYGDDGR